MTNKPKIWALCDDRAGNVGQCLGVAEALGMEFERKDIAYTACAKLPNFILGASLRGVDAKTKASLKAPWPDLVIAAGRRTASVARYIKKENKGQTKLVQIMHPGASGAKDFDLICVPAHDIHDLQENEITMLGAPHRVTDRKLAEARDHWSPVFENLPHPRLALIVGGATKNKVFDNDMARTLGRDLNRLAKEQGGSLLVTTSRRTGQAAEAVLGEIDVPAHIFSWGQEGENPYFGYLACADHIIVTGDSVSMCSEACASEKPVSFYAPSDMISDKHQRMVKSLIDAGAGQLFEGKITQQTGKKINAAVAISSHITRLIKSTY
ncbi:MAG: mitochondrial fission ELM1 family protein [Methylocystaceae bacterium]|nr:mitochondrial fission ELM1 family protein [Methylocystaceae bacterium]